MTSQPKNLKGEKVKPTLGAKLTKSPDQTVFDFWIVGITPLICHAWSEKAKNAMLLKQTKAVKPGREARVPEEDFAAALYSMGEDKHGKEMFGFPATAVKRCIVSAAHKDKGLARSALQAALWIHHDIVRVRPALAGAVCDMPLIRVYGTEPEMREDMVRVGAGLNKTASLSYRAQFSRWAMRITGVLNNTNMVPVSAMMELARAAGMTVGIGDWRTEKGGMFGSFVVASEDMSHEWEKFARSGDAALLPAPLDLASMFPGMPGDDETSE
jgi:hypothetical protein